MDNEKIMVRIQDLENRQEDMLNIIKARTRKLTVVEKELKENFKDFSLEVLKCLQVGGISPELEKLVLKFERRCE